ncbi:hypothetical protein DACRYDRAFT_21847 [Dacryopinax primogenitus]|uniref:Uncharacterized protein n=1 Tax=Dacryopinax primogenitus (strain DJM 731) TaxID=1858805 RepID=M5G3X8_DACPD|nr:uncharacterized protein DACRYDRAFT_21847 [Dacryopinax primogenitus]EJU02915.1 hypothetical protein DACRYDRAFT_21847 [Dacryopinax primogenitus]
MVSNVLRQVVKAIPKACDTGPISKVLCLWHYDLSSGNILSATRGPDAGKIISVIDWDGAIVNPIWCVVRWPNFIAVQAGRRYRSEADTKRYQVILRNELLRLDTEGLLRTSFQQKYELSRELLEVVTQPWNATFERQEWLDKWN